MPDDVAHECEALAAKLTATGHDLWVGGWMFGPDRVAGRTRHGIGDEPVYSAGLVIEIAGDAGTSSVLLMRAGNTYSAQALVRLLIECEYLLVLFANDREAGREWLNADAATLRTYWSPQKMRNRAGGVFSDTEYWSHSAMSAHPTADARQFLASHGAAIPVEAWWEELRLHLRRITERADQLVQLLRPDRGRDP